jgi:hypothetical protein
VIEKQRKNLKGTDEDIKQVYWFFAKCKREVEPSGFESQLARAKWIREICNLN